MPTPLTVIALQERAKDFNSVISLPTFETTAAAVFDSVTNTIRHANAALDTIGRRAPAQMAFSNTVQALDDIGYDAAYYGYGWADAIAADLATKFESSRDGYFDTEVGQQLRKEIYEPGNSRDVNESIKKFLGRPQSIEPFLKSVGIETKPASTSTVPAAVKP